MNKAIQEVIEKQTAVDKKIHMEKLEDEKTRSEYIESLPAFIAEVTGVLINELGENLEEFYNGSGSDWIQYKIEDQMKGGEMDKNNVEHRFSFSDVHDLDGYNPVRRWMLKMLKHDYAHIQKLHHPIYNGGGSQQFIAEGLFRVNNLGETNMKFTSALQKRLETHEYVRLLLGNDWGTLSASLTLTYPKPEIPCDEMMELVEEASREMALV